MVISTYVGLFMHFAEDFCHLTLLFRHSVITNNKSRIHLNLYFSKRSHIRSIAAWASKVAACSGFSEPECGAAGYPGISPDYADACYSARRFGSCIGCRISADFLATPARATWTSV